MAFRTSSRWSGMLCFTPMILEVTDEKLSRIKQRKIAGDTFEITASKTKAAAEVQLVNSCSGATCYVLRTAATEYSLDGTALPVERMQ